MRRDGLVFRPGGLTKAVVHWSDDNWLTANDANTRDTGLGLHLVDLPTVTMRTGSVVTFTFYWPEAKKWENTNFSVDLQEGL